MERAPDYVLHVTHYSRGDRLEALADLVNARCCEWAPIFTYFNTTDRAVRFNEMLRERGVPAEVVTGSTKPEARLATLERVRNGGTLVLSLCGYV